LIFAAGGIVPRSGARGLDGLVFHGLSPPAIAACIWRRIACRPQEVVA
jgi:hypothetical protein